MTLLYIAFLAFSIIQWFRNKKAISIIFLIFSLCNCFRLLDLGSISGKVADYALIYVFVILVYSYKNINLKGDFVGKLVITIVGYCTISLICTIVFTEEKPILAFQAYRRCLTLLMYFVIKQLNSKELFDTIKYTLWIVIISALLYILQPLGIHLYQGGQDETFYAGEMTRYRNAPNYIHFFILFLLFSNFKISTARKYICLLILLCGLILPMSRTSIFTLGVVIIVYLLSQREMKAVFGLTIVCLIAFAIFGSYWEYRMGSTDTSNDIMSALSMRNYKDYDGSGGTFQFRIAMLMERIDYLWKSQNIWFGIGFPHELSAYTRSHFNFMVGTSLNTEYGMLRCYIETPDISWVTLLMRLGLIGIILYMSMFFYMCKRFFKFHMPLGVCALLWQTYLLLTSFSGDVIGMSAFNNYCLMFVLYNYIIHYHGINKDRTEQLNRIA